MFTEEEDSQEGFTTVFKKSTDNAPSKSNDEIIDLTNNNNHNDDIIGVVNYYTKFIILIPKNRLNSLIKLWKK